ncbi:MAG TPA: Ig-like domain-containing protein [Candidatus Nanoarchaeia archaeon]|nr:Ig-like domain-containing protein [Candidatus Nanoarchaeia archaeon]
MKRTLLLITAVVLAGLGLASTHWHSSVADASSCSGITVDVVSPQTNAQVAGTTTLAASVTNYPGLNKVEFWVNGSVLGQGQASSTNYSYWQMGWDSRALPNGTYPLVARAYYHNSTSTSTGDVTCDSSPVPFYVNNQTAVSSNLVLELHPTTWEGPTNVSSAFSVNSFLIYSNGTKNDVTAQTAFTWSTSLGTLNHNGNQASFFSGPNAGTGEVKIHADYGGKAVDQAIKITVKSQVSGSSYPTTQSSNSPTAASSPGDPQLEACLKQAVGDSRYQQITSGASRLTETEFQKASHCFAQHQFVVPTNLAPVAPAKVKDLPKSPDLEVSEVKNSLTKQSDGSSKAALTLSGKAIAGKTVLIYVFSEPLVLAANTDKDGRWSYTLENPLKPGKHEVYVAAEKDPNSYVGSNPFFISVARAASTAENPEGDGLSLAAPNSSIVTFGLYAAIAIIAGLVAHLFLTMWRGRITKPNARR